MIIRIIFITSALIAALLIIPSFINWNTYKESLLSQVNAHSGFVVSLDGPIKLSLLPLPHLSLTDVTVLKDQSSAEKTIARPFVKLKYLSLRIDLLPLLHKKISISRVELIEPVITLENNEKENYSLLLNNKNKNSEIENTPKKDLSFNISQISIINGSVIFSNNKEKTKTEIQKINLSGAFGFEKGFDLIAEASVNGMAIKGNLKGGHFIGMVPQTFNANFNILSNSTVNGILVASGMMKDGSFIINMKSEALKLPVSVPVGDVVLDFSKGVALIAQATLKNDLLSIQNFKLSVSDISLTAKGSYDVDKNRGSLTFLLTSQLVNASGKIDLDLTHTKPMITADVIIPKLEDRAWTKEKKSNESEMASKHNQKSNKKEEKTWPKEPIDLKALQLVDVNCSLLIEKLHISGIAANAAKIHLLINNGIASLKQFSLSMFGGNITASGSLNSHNYHLDLATNVINAQLKMLPGMTDTPLKDGTLNFSATLTTQIKSMQSAIDQLSGKARLQIDKGVVRAFDIKQFIADLKGFKNLSSLSKLKEDFERKQDVFFNHIRGDFTITNGVMNTQNLEFNFNEGTLMSVGILNLPQWTLDLKSTINVKAEKNVPDLSFNITGALDQPNFALDWNALEETLIKVAANQVADRAKKEIQKQLADKLDDVGKGHVSEHVGKQVSNAIGKLLPGLLGR